MRKVLLVTPKYIILVSRGTSIISNLRVENALYHKYIYTHSKCSWNAHMLIPFGFSFYSYLSGLIWVFIPYMEFTYFGALRLITIYSFKKNPSGSCYIYGEIISLKDKLVWDFNVALHGFSESHNCIFWFMPLARFII